MAADTHWETWLASPECRKALLAAAQLVYRQAQRLVFPRSLLPCDHPWQLDLDQRQDCFEEMADELWQFLAEQPPAWRERARTREMARLGGRVLVLGIVQEYLQHLRDRSRTYGRDPYRALYRRLRQLLQQEPTVHYHATRTSAFYSYSTGTPLLPDGIRLQGPPYGGWPSPLGIVESRNLLKRENLLQVARFFWDQSGAQWGSAYTLPIRELVRFLMAHYGEVLADPVEQLLSDSGEPSEIALTESRGDFAEDADLALVRSRLTQLATQVAAGYSPLHRQVFLLIYGEEMTLEQCAERLGYRSAAGVKYQHQIALNRLRDFCLMWPGLSPPGLDKKLFEEFLLELIAVCKKME